jgi:hypothetical protein
MDARLRALKSLGSGVVDWGKALAEKASASIGDFVKPSRYGYTQMPASDDEDVTPEYISASPERKREIDAALRALAEIDKEERL